VGLYRGRLAKKYDRTSLMVGRQSLFYNVDQLEYHVQRDVLFVAVKGKSVGLVGKEDYS